MSGKPKLKDYFTKQFLQFLCCNGFAAVVNFCSRILINKVTGYTLSIVLAYGLGMTTAFLLSKFFVFNKSTHNTARQALGFVIVNMVALVQTLFFSWLFRSVVFPATGFTFHPDEIAHLIGITVPIFTSYIGHKYLSFGVED